MLNIIETYMDNGKEFEVFECQVCGWTCICEAGADPCCCPECEGGIDDEEA